MILDIMILLILLKDISVILISYTCKVYVWNKKKLKYNKMTTSISSKEQRIMIVQTDRMSYKAGRERLCF